MGYGNLNIEEQKFRLLIAYEILTGVHSNLCHYGSRNNDIRYEEDLLNIVQPLLHLIAKMDKECAKNGLPTTFIPED